MPASTISLQAPSALEKRKRLKRLFVVDNILESVAIQKEHKQGNIISISVSPSIRTFFDPCSDQADIKKYVCCACPPV